MAFTKLRSYSISIAFLAIIAFPLINRKGTLLKDIANTENRQLASKPVFDINHLDAYPTAYEKYYNDHFTARSRLVKDFNRLNVIAFKKSPFPDKFIIGNDGWLFNAGNDMDAYTGKHKFDPSELAAIKNELEYRKKYLNDRGCKFYFLVVPVKTNIYSDEMPGNKLRINKQSHGVQLIDYLNNTSQVKPINIFNTLKANKDHEILFYKLDTHWNLFGAFIASNEVLSQIHLDFPGVVAPSPDEYVLTKKEIYRGNLAEMLADTSLYIDFDMNLSPKKGFKAESVASAGYPCIEGFPYCSSYEQDKQIPDSKAPKILIISDSFGENIYPFLAEHFSRSVKIFDAWQYKLNEDIVNKEKPDIVLLITVESNVRNMLKHQSRLGEK
jgi:alginate O-acetyltransferase complex protein AlgJ